MSTISAGTSSGTALVSTGDTSGNLELQSSGVTKLTVGSSGVTLASALPATSGGTGATTYTTGDVIYASATNTLSKLGIGSSGQVLSVSGGVPAWATPASGAMVLLSTVTASSSSTVDIETGIGSTYDNYVIIFSNVRASVDNVEFQIRLKINGTYQTSNYTWMTINSSTATPTGAFQTSQTEIGFSSSAVFMSGSNTSAQGQVTFNNPTNTSIYKTVSTMYTTLRSTTTASMGSGMGAYVGGTQALTGVRFKFGGTDLIAAGTFRLYGIANS